MRALNLEVPEEHRPYLRLGTCSWKYDSWKGIIYREGVDYGPFDYLPEYARYFSTVEVDQWFWSLFPTAVTLPDEETVRRYAESVPEDFLFSVKVPNAITLTHFYGTQPRTHRDYANRPNEHFLSIELFRSFLATLAPMGGKLGPLILQFPYLNREKMPSLRAFLDRLHAFFQAAPAGFHYAIETRNPNHLKQELFDFLGEHGLGFVFLEGYYMPPIGEVFARCDTSPAALTIVRLHGPDRAEMEERAGGEWNRVYAPKLEGLQAAAKIVSSNTVRSFQSLVNVNNHYEGSAPLTAERFLAVLREQTELS